MQIRKDNRIVFNEPRRFRRFYKFISDIGYTIGINPFPGKRSVEAKKSVLNKIKQNNHCYCEKIKNQNYTNESVPACHFMRIFQTCRLHFSMLYENPFFP